MAKGNGTNGAKIGRHTRGTSNKLQVQRTAKNKAKAIAKARAEGISMSDWPGCAGKAGHMSKEDKRLREAEQRRLHKTKMVEARVALRKEQAEEAVRGDWHLKLIPSTVRLEDWKLAMKARVSRQRKAPR